MKALGYGLPAIGFDDVEILAIEPGRVKLHGVAQDLAIEQSITQWHLSVSRDERFVHTVAIAE